MSHCSQRAVVLPFWLVCLNVITSTVTHTFVLHSTHRHCLSNVSEAGADWHFQIDGCYFVAADCSSLCLKFSKTEPQCHLKIHQRCPCFLFCWIIFATCYYSFHSASNFYCEWRVRAQSDTVESALPAGTGPVMRCRDFWPHRFQNINLQSEC